MSDKVSKIFSLTIKRGYSIKGSEAKCDKYPHNMPSSLKEHLQSADVWILHSEATHRYLAGLHI